MKKKLGSILLAAGMILALAACGAGNGTKDAGNESQESVTDTAEVTAAVEAGQTEEGGQTDAELLTGLHHVEIEVQGYDQKICAELDADTAPITVTNFVNLAKDGFYDGLTFHRVISGFMIQGGDPLGNGMGGSDQTIKGEFAANGITNDIAHDRGVISMARSQAYDSASSQFFIMHADYPSLDGQYAAFGHVTDGMDVVDAIAENTPVQDSNGTVAAQDQPVIVSITVID